MNSIVDFVSVASNGTSLLLSIGAAIWLFRTNQYIRSKGWFLGAQIANIVLQASAMTTTLVTLRNGGSPSSSFAATALDQLTLVAVVVEIFLLAWINVCILEIFVVIPRGIFSYLTDKAKRNLLKYFKVYILIALSLSTIAVTIFGILTCVHYPASPLSHEGQKKWKKLLLIGSAGCAITDNFLAQYVAFIIYQWNRFRNEKTRVAKQYYKLVLFNLFISFGDYIAVALLFINFYLWNENVSIKMGLFAQVGFHSTAAVMVFLNLKRLTFVGSPNDVDLADGIEPPQLSEEPRLPIIDSAAKDTLPNTDVEEVQVLPIYSIDLPARAAFADRATESKPINILISPFPASGSPAHGRSSRFGILPRLGLSSSFDPGRTTVLSGNL